MTVNAKWGVVDELARRLHECNVLEKTGNSNKALKAVTTLIDELNGSHLTLSWDDTHCGEWVLIDTLLFEREKEE